MKRGCLVLLLFFLCYGSIAGNLAGIGLYCLPLSVLKEKIKPGVKVGYGHWDFENNKIIVKVAAVVGKDGKIPFLSRGYIINGKSKTVREILKLIDEHEELLMKSDYGGENAWRTVLYSNSSKERVWFYGDVASVLLPKNKALNDLQKNRVRE